MTQDGKTSSVYLRPDIILKIDILVEKNKELYKSRSQLINSLLYKFLREKGEIPAVTEEK